MVCRWGVGGTSGGWSPLQVRVGLDSARGSASPGSVRSDTDGVALRDVHRPGSQGVSGRSHPFWRDSLLPLTVRWWGVSLSVLLSRWGAACGDEFSGDDRCVQS